MKSYWSFIISSGTTCIDCTAGNYCPQGATSETACTSGYYSEAAAAVCIICPAGFYCPDTSTKTACPSGQYSLAGELSCTDCPAGISRYSKNHNYTFVGIHFCGFMYFCLFATFFCPDIGVFSPWMHIICIYFFYILISDSTEV